VKATGQTTPTPGDALLVVDVQNDFMPGGALGVKDGDQIIPAMNRSIELFLSRDLPVFYSRDWHPANHASFLAGGGIWPPHCVQQTGGARFFAELLVATPTRLFSKGTRAAEEQYSPFHAEDEAGSPLSVALQRLGIEDVYIGGLATDYCVLNTALDLLDAGYRVSVLTDACRAVDVSANDGQKALETMIARGARSMSSRDLRS
jgi:nicotinamidase/pyrazinamidase